MAALKAVARPLAKELRELPESDWTAALGGGLVAISVLLWLPFVHGLTRSLSRMTQVAEGRKGTETKTGRSLTQRTRRSRRRGQEGKTKVFSPPFHSSL